MNDTIINNINKNVKENDSLYILGDVTNNNLESVYICMSRIKCKNVHLIFGNHDDCILYNEYSKIGNTCICNVFKSCKQANFIKYKDFYIYLLHYKCAVWRDSSKGSLHLYGHSHSLLEGMYNDRSMDVGIDNAYKLVNEYRPFHIDEIIEILKNKPVTNIL